MQQKLINLRTVTFYCLIFFCFFLLSCTKTEDEKKYHRLRKEVLAHYRTDTNPLKEKAALFLLDNLKDRYAIEGEKYNTFSDTIKMYYPKADSLSKKLLLLKNLPLANDIVLDVTRLTPQFLIGNIDQAFDAWEKAAWKDQVRFDFFCEYILPYRIGNEPLENWRKEVLQDTLFKIIKDTIFTISTIKKAATFLSIKQSKLKEGFLQGWGPFAAGIPDLQFSILNILTAGTCANLTQNSLFACRAVAIPISNDFTPHWANRTLGHDWAAINTKSGTIPFILPVTDSLGNHKGSDAILSKVYRYTFSENKVSHLKQRGYCRFLPDFFNNPRLVDVTDLYMTTHNVFIPICSNSDKSKFVYLAVSDRESWVPVAWGTTKNSLATFTTVGENSVYLPIISSDNGIQPINYPFVLSTKGEVRYLKPDFKNMQRVELIRKHPMKMEIIKSVKKMINSKFQAANNKDFRNPVTLHTISDLPEDYYQEVQLQVTGKYRYVRFLGRDSSRCNIAEMEFYEKYDTKPLKGNIIGTKGNDPFKAFDGNALTYFNTLQDTNIWIGLDLGKRTNIDKICFLPRNDKNHVLPGNLYELFYWENEWKSLGQKTATDKILVYDRIPTNCLLLLRNFTEGIEERIFTYENGKQVWW